MTGSKATYLTETSSTKDSGGGGTKFLDQPVPPSAKSSVSTRDSSANILPLGANTCLPMGTVGGLQGAPGRTAPIPPPREVSITGRMESLRDPLLLPTDPPARPSLRTESLERPPTRERRLREASGRCSAEPLEYFVAQELRPPAPLRLTFPSPYLATFD